MEGIPLRTARRQDIPMLLLLWEQMMKENAALDPRLAPHPRAKEHMMGQFQQWIADEDRLVVVAEEGRRLVVGYIAAGLMRGSDWKPAARVAEITDCFVVAPRRRRGIARRLVGRVHDQFIERGVDRFRLQAAAANTGSRAFWEAIGWRVGEVVLEREAPPAPPADESPDGGTDAPGPAQEGAPDPTG